MILAEVVNQEAAAIVAGILAALGGVGGIQTFIRKVQKLVDAADDLKAKGESLDQIIKDTSVAAATLRDHSVRLVELERSKVAFNDFDAQLNRNEALGFAWMESFDYGCWVSDNKGLCVYANTALCKLLGCSKDQLIGASWKDLIHPDDRQSVTGRWADFVSGDRSLFSAHYRYLTPNGTVVDVLGNAIRPKNRHGRVADVIFGWVRAESPK